MPSPWVQQLVATLEPWLPPELSRAVIAAAVAVLGYLLARLARFAVTRLFRNISSRLVSLSRRASQRAGLPPAPESTEQAERAALGVSGQVAFWLVFALFLGAATAVLGFPVLSSWLESLAGYLPRVLAAAAIVFLGVLSGLLLRVAVTAAAGASGAALARSLGRAAQIAVIVLAAAAAIEALGIEITLLIVVAATAIGALLGGAALAFALGARDSVKNILASHYLGKHYRAGQVIQIGEHRGRIVDITEAAVILKTDTGTLYMPAGVFASEPSLRMVDAGDGS